MPLAALIPAVLGAASIGSQIARGSRTQRTTTTREEFPPEVQPIFEEQANLLGGVLLPLLIARSRNLALAAGGKEAPGIVDPLRAGLRAAGAAASGATAGLPTPPGSDPLNMEAVMDRILTALPLSAARTIAQGDLSLLARQIASLVQGKEVSTTRGGGGSPIAGIAETIGRFVPVFFGK